MKGRKELNAFAPLAKGFKAFLELAEVMEENIKVEDALATNNGLLASVRRELAAEKDLLGGTKDELAAAQSGIVVARKEADEMASTASREAGIIMDNARKSAQKVVSVAGQESAKMEAAASDLLKKTTNDLRQAEADLERVTAKVKIEYDKGQEKLADQADQIERNERRIKAFNDATKGF